MIFSIFYADAQVRSFRFTANEEMLYLIDTNTIKLTNKLYPTVDQGDLNIYGFEENEIPVYADSVYAYRLSILESEIPMDYNEYVRRYIDMYTLKRRKLVSRMLTWSQYYFPDFEAALDKANMPVELKYMAVIESALNPNAVSPVGAAGMWQFMPATGRMYGLKTGSQYDERRDVPKSTEAAIKYLQNSYRIYGDWLLVIASYNCGPGNVNKAIKRAGGIKNFWAIQAYLPAETRGYVPAFIAAAYAMTYASAHNIYPDNNQEIVYFTDTVQVDNRYNLGVLAADLGLSLEDIRKLNPSLRTNNIPFIPGGISLHLPYNKSMALTEMLSDTAYKYNADRSLMALHGNKLPQQHISNKSASTVYTVRSGDNLGAIAKRYGVSVAEIKKWNKLSNNNIAAGKKLIVRRG